MGHTDNYIPANPLVTPTHIVPEWYFLPFYAILRSIPNKLVGVISLVFSIFILFVLPWLLSSLVKGSIFSKNNTFIFWMFSGCTLILGWIGQKSIETEFLFTGTSYWIYLFYLFFYFFRFDYLCVSIFYKKSKKWFFIWE